MIDPSSESLHRKKSNHIFASSTNTIFIFNWKKISFQCLGQSLSNNYWKKLAEFNDAIFFKQTIKPQQCTFINLNFSPNNWTAVGVQCSKRNLFRTRHQVLHVVLLEYGTKKITLASLDTDRPSQIITSFSPSSIYIGTTNIF